MAYVPDDAHWFLANLVEEIQVEGAKRNVVHINYVIVEAASPEDAYKRAIKIGKQANQSYVNTHGKRVTIRFRGLNNLDVIHDPLEHGCEIMFRETLGLSESAIQKLLSLKGKLEVFSPIRRRPGRPDYASKEIMDEAHRELSKRTK
ncbi:MAG: DUF4288 domain-containing protein [Verrucomicrobiota bacterium]|nr:DUF4288 domain-containing protein [Verrucomicrobiota bacterium]